MNPQEADQILGDALGAAATRIAELSAENVELRRARAASEERDRSRQDDGNVYREQRDRLRLEIAELEGKVKTYEAAIACVAVLTRTWRTDAVDAVFQAAVEGFARQVEVALRGEDHTQTCQCGHYVLAHDHSGCAWCRCLRGHGVIASEAVAPTEATGEAVARLQRVTTYLQNLGGLGDLSGVERMILNIIQGIEGTTP